MMSLLYRALIFACSFWCHQRGERSPHLFGVQFPLCWRCTGIAFGMLLLIIWLLTKKRLPPLALSLALSLLMPLDALTAMAGLWDGANSLRFATGILWGALSACVLLHLLRWWQSKRVEQRTLRAVSVSEISCA